MKRFRDEVVRRLNSGVGVQGLGLNIAFEVLWFLSLGLFFS